MTANRRQRAKRYLSAEQKYDLWVRMLTGQLTTVQAAPACSALSPAPGPSDEVERRAALVEATASLTEPNTEQTRVERTEGPHITTAPNCG